MYRGQFTATKSRGPGDETTSRLQVRDAGMQPDCKKKKREEWPRRPEKRNQQEDEQADEYEGILLSVDYREQQEVENWE